MVDQCCSVHQERSVTDWKCVFAVRWRIVLGCFVKCMSGNGWGGTSLPPPSLFPLIVPSAVSPPPLHCQHACAAQVILYHCSNKARQRKWHFSESAVRCKMASVSVRMWRLYSQWDKLVPKSVAWDIIVKLWTTFCVCIWTALPHACVFVCNGLRLWSGHLL